MGRDPTFVNVLEEVSRVVLKIDTPKVKLLFLVQQVLEGVD